MCSIIGYCGPVLDSAAFQTAFQRTLSRGPDDSRVVKAGSGVLGFHRLSIMGLTPSGMQPFSLGESLLVCNGEIYGFETFKSALAGKYTFHSDSDCEILLPLYREYGVDMFRMLDAEFALILYDAQSHEFIAARDPIGIRPLYYGYDSRGTILFASEPKNLMGLAAGRIMPFPPGHYYKDGQFIRYADVTRVDRVIDDPPEEISRSIREKLTAAVVKRLAQQDPERYGSAEETLSAKAEKAARRRKEQQIHEKKLRTQGRTAKPYIPTRIKREHPSK